MNEQEIIRYVETEVKRLEKESDSDFQKLLSAIKETAETARNLENEVNRMKDREENGLGAEQWLVGAISKDLPSLSQNYCVAAIKSRAMKELLEKFTER